MKRFCITLSAHTCGEEGYLLLTAAKMLSELQAMGTQCRLVPAQPPWQLAMEGYAEDFSYIQRQVLDLVDGRRGKALIKKMP